MSISTAATELLGIDRPIVLAPMDAVAGGALAAAVSKAGGLGMIGGGYGDDAWLRRQFSLAEGERVGCGFITWSLARQPRLLDVALECAPRAVMLSFGDPSPFASVIRSAGALLVCQVQDLDQARRALDVGADVLVAQGSEAGGHGRGSRTTMTLLPEIVDLVASRAARVPVLGAGGIADGRGVAATLALGGAGAVLGSRFYVAAEALSTEAARQCVVAATGDDTVRTTVYDAVRRPWPEGHTISVLRNDFTSRWHGAEEELQARLAAVRAHFEAAVDRGDYRTANVTIGQAAGLIHSVAPAARIVADITDQASAILQGSLAS